MGRDYTSDRTFYREIVTSDNDVIARVTSGITTRTIIPASSYNYPGNYPFPLNRVEIKENKNRLSPKKKGKLLEGFENANLSTRGPLFDVYRRPSCIDKNDLVSVKRRLSNHVPSRALYFLSLTENSAVRARA